MGCRQLRHTVTDSMLAELVHQDPVHSSSFVLECRRTDRNTVRDLFLARVEDKSAPNDPGRESGMVRVKKFMPNRTELATSVSMSTPPVTGEWMIGGSCCGLSNVRYHCSSAIDDESDRKLEIPSMSLCSWLTLP